MRWNVTRLTTVSVGGSDDGSSCWISVHGREVRFALLDGGSDQGGDFRSFLASTFSAPGRWDAAALADRLQIAATTWGNPFDEGSGVAYAAGRITDVDASIAWAGDVRVHLISDVELVWSTTDHSVRAEASAKGVVLPGSPSRYNGVLTRFLSSGLHVSEVATVSMLAAVGVLACTRAMHRYRSPSDYAVQMAASTLATAHNTGEGSTLVRPCSALAIGFGHDDSMPVRRGE